MLSLSFQKEQMNLSAQEMMRRVNSEYSSGSEQVVDSKMGFQPILMSIDVDIPKEKSDLASS
jgi:hypothetical protein